MNKIINWIKNNLVITILLLIILILLGLVLNKPRYSLQNRMLGTGMISTLDTVSKRAVGIPNYESTPNLNVEDRMVVKTTNISLVVKDVTEAIKTIENKASSLGGYVVNSSVVSPEGLSKGDISIRVPTERLDDTISYLEDTVSLKVVSKEVQGRDVTDDYIDIEKRITTLQNSKTKYEQLLNSTNDIEQIFNITNRIISLEERIDNLKGRQQYLEGTSKTALIRVNLATTELELPYNPETMWQPKVIFRYAVRSLVGAGRSLATALIWIGVYSVIWIPAVVIYIVWKRKSKK